MSIMGIVTAIIEAIGAFFGAKKAVAEKDTEKEKNIVIHQLQELDEEIATIQRDAIAAVRAGQHSELLQLQAQLKDKRARRKALRDAQVNAGGKRDGD